MALIMPFLLSAPAVLFYLITITITPVCAHGHDATDTHTHYDGAMSEGAATKNLTEYPITYFTHVEHSGTMYAHITLMVLAWVFVLPIAVMFSIAMSRYTLVVQGVFIATNAVGVALAGAYNAETPDLYPNNAHHKIGWVVTLVISVHILVNFVGRVANKWGSSNTRSSSHNEHPFLPATTQNSAFTRNGYSTPAHLTSGDIGNGSDTEPSSGRNSSVSTICAEDTNSRGQHHKEFNNDDEELEDVPFLSSLPKKTTWAANIARSFAGSVVKYADIGYKVVDRIILPFGFVALTTGVATFAGFFEGHRIFGGLAHWIKGGVFFWLGLFNLGRWSGSFAELGWAWNLRPRNSPRQKQNFRPSAELIESALILFYGSTNIFLEHLSGWGGEWTAQDLEHMAITVLFIGGGLCGILIESSYIRDFLNTNATRCSITSYSDEERGQFDAPETYVFSLNPIPALVILLLGIMMSSHHQSTMTATTVHKQWGALLLWSSVARSLTYVLLYLRPPKSVLPSRPPTELLASFGLIAGGLIFMASSSDTVEGMIHYDLDAMFLYTVTMGLVGILMAWEVTVLAVKGWAAQREQALAA